MAHLPMVKVIDLRDNDPLLCADLARQRSYTRNQYPTKLHQSFFFLYRYFLRKIFPSVEVVLAVNFAANFWRQAVLAQF